MKLETEYWAGCYSGSFDLLSPDSFAHPAKMSGALCYRIIEHLEELGLLKPGMTILDPMGGTGITAICANAKGYRAVTVELEEKFVGFQRKNKEYAARKLGKPLDWTIIQGDSRKLSELLSEHCVTVTSPPYGDAISKQGGEISDDLKSFIGRSCGEARRYSHDPNNIGNLKDKPLTVMSPPYGDVMGRQSHEGASAHGKGIEPSASAHYGETQGNIGNEQAESYLSAMKLVYAEIAKVSDVCVVVTKNPTRAGKLRRLDSDTIALLKDCGYEILCQHKALLFTESEHQDLFGETHKKLRGRVSFFKRLSIAKGNVAASWEDILFAIKKDRCIPIEKIADASNLPITSILENVAASIETNLGGITANTVNENSFNGGDDITRTTDRPLGLGASGRVMVNTNRAIAIENPPNVMVNKTAGHKTAKPSLAFSTAGAKPKRNQRANHMLRADGEHIPRSTIPLRQVDLVDWLSAVNFVSQPGNYILISEKQLHDISFAVGADIAIGGEQSEKISFGLRVNRIEEGFVIDICTLMSCGDTVSLENSLIGGNCDVVVGHQDTRAFALFVTGTKFSFLLHCKSAINEASQGGGCHFNSNYTIKLINTQSERKLVTVSSPPYAGDVSASNSDLHPEKQQSKPAGRQYGDTPGQIGRLH